MNAQKTTRIPKLRHHKATGQAYVVLNGKTIYFGPSGTDEATEKYHQTIAEWMAAGKHIGQSPEDITINEVIARFWKYAQGYYVRPDGTQTYEVNNFRQALRPLQALYGTTRAAEFGPRALTAVRHKMVQAAWCRSNINKQCKRLIKTHFFALSAKGCEKIQGFSDIKHQKKQKVFSLPCR